MTWKDTTAERRWDRRHTFSVLNTFDTSAVKLFICGVLIFPVWFEGFIITCGVFYLLSSYTSSLSLHFLCRGFVFVESRTHTHSLGSAWFWQFGSMVDLDHPLRFVCCFSVGFSHSLWLNLTSCFVCAGMAANVNEELPAAAVRVRRTEAKITNILR